MGVNVSKPAVAPQTGNRNETVKVKRPRGRPRKCYKVDNVDTPPSKVANATHSTSTANKGDNSSNESNSANQQTNKQDSTNVAVNATELTSTTNKGDSSSIKESSPAKRQRKRKRSTGDVATNVIESTSTADKDGSGSIKESGPAKQETKSECSSSIVVPSRSNTTELARYDVVEKCLQAEGSFVELLAILHKKRRVREESIQANEVRAKKLDKVLADRSYLSGIGSKRKREELGPLRHGYLKQRMPCSDGSVRNVYYYPTEHRRLFERRVRQPKSNLFRLESNVDHRIHTGRVHQLNMKMTRVKRMQSRILSPLDRRYIRKARPHVKKRKRKNRRLNLLGQINTLYRDAPDTRLIPQDLLLELATEQETLALDLRVNDPLDGNLLAIANLSDPTTDSNSSYFVVAFPVKQYFLCVRAFNSVKSEYDYIPADVEEIKPDILNGNNCAMVPVGYRIYDIKIFALGDQTTIAVRTQCTVNLYRLERPDGSRMRVVSLHAFKPALVAIKYRQCKPIHIAVCPYDMNRYAMIGDTGYVCIFDIRRNRFHSNVVDEWFVRDEDAQESGETWYTCVFGRHTQMLIVATRLKVYCLDLKYMRRRVLFETSKENMIVAMERTSGCSNDRHVIIATVDGFRLMDIHTKKILVQSRHHLGVLRHKGFHFASGRFFDLKRHHMFTWSSVPDYVTHVKYGPDEAGRNLFLESTTFAERKEEVIHKSHFKTLPLAGMAVLFTDTKTDQKFRTFAIFQLYRNGLLQVVTYLHESQKYKALAKQVLTYDVDTEFEELPLEPEPLRDELSYESLKHLTKANVDGDWKHLEDGESPEATSDIPESATVLENVMQNAESRALPFMLSDLLPSDDLKHNFKLIPSLDSKLQDSGTFERCNPDISNKNLLLPFRYYITKFATHDTTSSIDMTQQLDIVKQNIALSKNVYIACKKDLEDDQFHYFPEANKRFVEMTDMTQWSAMYWETGEHTQGLDKGFIRPLTDEDIKPLFFFANERPSPEPQPKTPVLSASMPALGTVFEEDNLPPTVIEVASTIEKKKESSKQEEVGIKQEEDGTTTGAQFVASQPLPGTFGTRTSKDAKKKKPKKKIRASGFK